MVGIPEFTKLKRRKFFSDGFRLMGVFGTGGFLYSAFMYMSVGDMDNNPHLSSKNDQGKGVGAIGSLGADVNATSIEISAQKIPQGESRILAIGYIPVIVVHGDGGFKAFNATCSHLGCLVKWNQDIKKFVCPCHAGTYDRDGQVLSGPPPVGLRKCSVELNNDTLTISVE